MESSSTTVSSNTISFGDISDLISYGVKQGATVNKVSTSGVVQAYGYVTGFTNSAVTIDSASGISNGDTIRVNIPVRAANLCYIVNRMVGITGSDFLITEVNYTEDNGVMTSELELVEATNGLGARDNSIGKTLESLSTKENYKEDSPTNPKDVVSTVAFTLGDASGNNTHRDILYSNGTITAGGNTFNISQGVITCDITSDNLEQYIYHTGVEGVTSLATQRKEGASPSTNNYDFADKDRILLLWVRTNDVSVPEDLIFSTDPLNPSNLESLRGGFNGSKGLNNTGTIKLNQDLTAQSISFSSRTAYPRVDFTSGGILGKSDASTVEFSLDASNGKGMFGGGVCTIGRSGIYFPSPASDDTLALTAMEWNYNSKSTWLYRFTGTNVMRWLSDANTPADGRMDFVNMDIKLVGGDFFDGNTSLAALYGGGSSDADALHTHSSLGGGGSGDITSVSITAGTHLSGDVTTNSGAHTQTINHLEASGSYHIPALGASGNLLSYSASGQAQWQAPSALNLAVLQASTNVLRIGDGVYNGPAYSFTNDTDTGMYLYGATALSFSTAGTSRMHILMAAAEVEISGHLDLNGWTIYDFDECQARTDGSATDPTYTWINDTDVGMYYESGALCFTYGGNVQLKIKSTELTAHNDIRPNASGSYFLGSSTNRWSRLYASLATDVSSDAELKENKATITNGLDFITRLNPITFNRKDRTEIEFGFTAQEMKQSVLDSGYTEDMGVYSEVTDADTGKTEWGIAYESLVAPLVAAIKELKERIEVLEGN